MRDQKFSVILPLIIINVVAFVLQIAIPGFTDLFILTKGSILEPWRLLTSMFLHGGFAHLFFNMYALFLFGPLVEQRIGPKRFLSIYLISGLLASVVGSFIYLRALGASGAIMGVIGVLIIFNPDLRLLLFFAIPMSLRTAGILWILIDLFGSLNPYSGIANVAHLIGIFSGLGYGYYLKKKGGTYHQKVFVRKSELNYDDIDDYLKYGKL